MPALARALPRTALLLASMLLASGCKEIADTFFVVTSETESLCQSEHGLSFAAAGPGADTLVQTVTVPLGQIGQDLPEGPLTTELWLRLFELDVTGGGADLSALRTVKVSLRRQGATELIQIGRAHV